MKLVGMVDVVGWWMGWDGGWGGIVEEIGIMDEGWMVNGVGRWMR